MHPVGYYRNKILIELKYFKEFPPMETPFYFSDPKTNKSLIDASWAKEANTDDTIIIIFVEIWIIIPDSQELKYLRI